MSKIVFVQVFVPNKLPLFVLDGGIFAGAFTTNQQFMHPHCRVYYDKTWRQFWHAFTKMSAGQPSLTQYEWPMYHLKEK